MQLVLQDRVTAILSLAISARNMSQVRLDFLVYMSHFLSQMSDKINSY